MPQLDVTPRKKPRQARSRATVDAILEACARVLVDDGYERLTTTRVAEVAGVSVGSLYQYFPNREALLAALIERFMARLLAHLRAAVAEAQGASLPGKVRALLAGLLRVKREDPRLNAALTTQVPRVDAYATVKAVTDQAKAMVRALLADHASELRTRDLDLAAFVVVHAVDGVVGETVIDSPALLARPELLDELTALVLGYLRRPPPA